MLLSDMLLSDMLLSDMLLSDTLGGYSELILIPCALQKTLTAIMTTTKEQTVNRLLSQARELLNGRLIAPHQTDGCRWMIGRELSSIKGGILADEMGLGKTVQTITTILADDSATEPSLIVCDKSLVNQWYDQIKEFAPTLRPVKLTKQSMVALGVDGLRILGGKAVVITTYGALNRNQPVREIQWRRLVVDEAHKIKNQRYVSMVTALTMSLTVLAIDFRFCLQNLGSPERMPSSGLY